MPDSVKKGSEKVKKGSGLANCIKVPAEGFGESGRMSRAFFDSGDGMAQGGDIASKGLDERGERGGLGLDCQPGEQRARLGGQSRPSNSQEFFLVQAVATAHIGQQFSDQRRTVAGGWGFEDRFDKILLAHDARIGLSPVERRIMALRRPFVDESRKTCAGDSYTGTKLSQDPVGGKPRQVLSSEISPETAMGVGGGLRDHASANRVEVDIAHQGEAVGIPIDEVGPEAALEQMSHPFQSRIDVAGIAEGEVLHAGGQRWIPSLEGQVHVIGHEAERVHSVAEARHALRNQFIETATITWGKEDLLPGVAAQDNVVEAAGDVQSGFAGHEASIVKGRPLCN